MTDASSTPAIPVTIHRGDYRPPDWQVPDVALDFALAVEATRVGAALSVVRQADAPVPLVLRGDGLTPAAVRVVNWVLLAVGAVTIGYGLWLALALQRAAG